MEQKVIDLLICPECKSELEQKNNKFVCKKCGKEYFFKDNILVMI